MPNTEDQGQGQPPSGPDSLSSKGPVRSSTGQETHNPTTIPNNPVTPGSQIGTPGASTGLPPQTPGPHVSSRPQHQEQHTLGTQQLQSQQVTGAQRSLGSALPPPSQQPTLPSQHHSIPYPPQSGINPQPQYPPHSSTSSGSASYNQNKNYVPPLAPQPPPQNQVYQSGNAQPVQKVRHSGQPAPGSPSILPTKPPVVQSAVTFQSSPAKQIQSTPPPMRTSDTRTPQIAPPDIRQAELQEGLLSHYRDTQKQVETKAQQEVQPPPDANSKDNTPPSKESNGLSWRIPRVPIEVVVCLLLIVLLTAAFFLVKTLIAVKLLHAEFEILATFTFVLLVTLLVGFLWGLWWRALQTSQQRPGEIQFDEQQGLPQKLADTQQELDETKRERDQLLMETHNPAPKGESSQVQENETRVSSQALPRLSVYDKANDPPNYDETTTQHPHHKLYPNSANEESQLGYNWRIVGASRRGYGHAYTAKYREDDFAIRVFPGAQEQMPRTVLVAIADGVSSKEHSRYGALAAVQGATTFSPRSEADNLYKPEEAVHVLVRMLQANAPQEKYEDQAYGILYHSLYSAMLSVHARAEQARLTENDLQSTLMVFLAVPLGERRLFVASTQIGDGILFSLADNGKTQLRERWDWLQLAQIQGSGNEVQPFMRSVPETWQQFFKCTVLENAIFVMGMTDGTADDIEPPRATPENADPDPFTYVESFYQPIKKDVLSSPHPAQALDEFLGYKRVQSHDDRTVICLYKEKSH